MRKLYSILFFLLSCVIVPSQLFAQGFDGPGQGVSGCDPGTHFEGGVCVGDEGPGMGVSGCDPGTHLEGGVCVDDAYVGGSSASSPRDFKGVVGLFIEIINQLILVIFAITFITFIWGVINGWIINGASEAGVENGKNVVSASIIAFVVMGAVWGIVYLLKTSLLGV